MADKFLVLFLHELHTLVDVTNSSSPNTTANTNTTNTTTPTPIPVHTRSNSTLVTHLNYFLSSLYCVLLVITAVLLVQKIRKYRSLKVGLVYVCYILAMCIVRFIYLVMPSKGWVRVLKHSHGASYMNFIDLLPELIFVSIFLLTTVMWGIAWAKTRKIKIFKEHLVIYIHTGIVLLIMFVAVFISAAIRDRKTKYAEVVLWEAYYVITVSGVSVIASAILGGLLFHTFMLSNKFQKHSTNSTKRHMKHLLALLILTTVSFILKGVWNLVIGSIARKRWTNLTMSNGQFGTLWFFYYFITELLPISLALAQQWRSEIENPDSNTDSRNHSSKNSKHSAKRTKESQESRDESKELTVSMSTQSLTASDASDNNSCFEQKNLNASKAFKIANIEEPSDSRFLSTSGSDPISIATSGITPPGAKVIKENV
eukprot:Phypoly_transcript_07571.p1 GENE.Phypoly_transcript_07571~~Phypoly_transcript_07571.p1  ORF type:complete len:458 (+),score=39.34 Phypoly_transcript_07571:95-1375(+)